MSCVYSPRLNEVQYWDEINSYSIPGTVDLGKISGNNNGQECMNFGVSDSLLSKII